MPMPGFPQMPPIPAGAVPADRSFVSNGYIEMLKSARGLSSPVKNVSQSNLFRSNLICNVE